MEVQDCEFLGDLEALLLEVLEAPGQLGLEKQLCTTELKEPLRCWNSLEVLIASVLQGLGNSDDLALLVTSRLMEVQFSLALHGLDLSSTPFGWLLSPAKQGRPVGLTKTFGGPVVVVGGTLPNIINRYYFICLLHGQYSNARPASPAS